MWEALTKLYQNDSQNGKIVLKEDIKSTKMSIAYTITSYLTNITKIRDKLEAIGERMRDLELVRIALNEFTKPWAPFIKGIVA